MEEHLKVGHRPSAALGLRRWTGLAAAGVGAIVLIGGLLGVERATSWGDTLPRAVPATALIILFLGLAEAAGPRHVVGHVLLGTANAVVLLCTACRIAGDPGPLRSWSWEVPGRAVPAASTLVLYGLLVAAVIAVALGFPRVAQAFAAPVLVGALFMCTAILYGDRMGGEGVEHVEIISTAPTATAALLLSAGVLAATPTVGISGWFAKETPGRRAIRRLLPIAIGVQLLVAGIAQWTDLEDRIGGPRTWTLVMFVIIAGVAALSLSAADLMDRLSATAHRVETTELRLAAADQAAKVAGIARLLAAASSTQEVAEIVNRAVAGPFGASGASIGLIDEESGTLRVVHGVTVPEETRERLADPLLTAPLAFTEAAREGVPVLIEDADANRRRYPDGPGAVPGLGARAALPMRSRDGRCFGAVAVAWRHPVEFDARTEATLETVAQLIAQTLERTRLSDDVAAAAEHNRQMSLTAEALGSARNVQRLVDVLQERVSDSLGASYLTVGVVDPLAGMIHRYLPATIDPEAAARFAYESLEAHRPLVDAARERRRVVIAGISELRRLYPEIADEAETIGLRASASLPLVDVTGRTIGALGVAWEHESRMTTDRIEALGTIAQMAGQTLERVRLAEAEHRLVKNLQERILRPMPDLAGFDLAARYRPAAVELGMGGDWFEGIDLDPEGEHRLAVVVGDVVGHGIDAISDMAYLRSALATLLRTGAPLAELFTAVADAVDPLEVTATALAALLEPCAKEVEVVSAGHPPPIIVTAAGASQVIEHGRQPLIGVAPTTPVEPARLHLEQGDTLALYTDGLVEERHRSIDEGIGRLADLLVETRHLPVEEQVDRVLSSRLAEGRSEDDIALVLIRRTTC